MWEIADPSSAGALDRRATLAKALAELEHAGLLRRSATTDRSATPPLPTQVSLPVGRAAPSAAELAADVIWRPELAWVPSARLTTAQVGLLAKVNTWLRDRGRDGDIVPLRERSWEILGNEKGLDRALGTGLFADDRLTLTMLRTFRSHPPLPVVRVGDGRVLLVVENEDTFTTLLTCARRDPLQVAFVAWGAGGAFEAAVRSVVDLRPAVDEVRYFGDLDFDGLRIPTNSARTAATENLPPVLPATGLYRRLLAVGAGQPSQPVPDAAMLVNVTRWLDTAPALADTDGTIHGALSAHAADLLSNGLRIPQEALGTRQLATSWPGPR
jgi:hypothetical protein